MRALKMNGLGNEFAVVDARRTHFQPTETEVRALGDRATGLGFDQMFALEKPSTPMADVFMRIWNADGEEVSACGNGARCVAWLSMEERGSDHAVIETRAGLLAAHRAGDHLVTVDMGEPGLSWEQIPLAERMDTLRIELQVGPIDNPILWGPCAVSMGNPHCVFFVEDIGAYDIERIGPLIEGHPLFPERTNVGFAQVIDRTHIRLRVFERGAGLTKACGTGACAALVAGVRRRLVDRKAILHLDGGDLTIEWRESDNHVLMTGPVALDGEKEMP